MPESEWQENAIEWLSGAKTVTVTLWRGKLQNKVMALAKKDSRVKICVSPDENGGALVAHVPAAWIKVDPPRKVEMTEERKEELRERLVKMRKAKEQ